MRTILINALTTRLILIQNHNGVYPYSSTPIANYPQ